MSSYFRWFGLPGSFVLTVLMSLFALALFIIFRKKDRFICFLGMFVSTIGDIILMNFKDIGDLLPIPYFYVGACFFIIAHIIYTYAFLSMIKENKFKYVNPGFWVSVAVSAVTGVIITYLYFTGPNPNIVMFVLCMVYLVIIATNCATIFSFSYSVKDYRCIAAVGALSFFVSDLFIGLDKLAGISTDLLQECIWWFYPIGQILLLIGG